MPAAVLRVMTSPSWASVENRRAHPHQPAASNEALNVRRATERRLRREMKATPPDAGRRPHPDLDVLDALRRLSVRQRAVVYLSYRMDLPVREVAEVLGIAAGSVE